MTLAATPVINVLVAHSDPLVAMGVAATLAGRHDFAVRQVGADGGPEEAALAAGGIDVIVADFEEGTRLAERRRERRPGDARILILTAQDGERDIRRALELGVHGYARTNRPLQEFIDGVRALHRGARHLCPMTAQRLAESLMRETLTARETDVLSQLALGSCNKTIASELDLAVGTVKAHIKGLMSKLGRAHPPRRW